MYKVIHNSITPMIEEIFKLPKEQQRLLWYTDKINSREWEMWTYSDDDEKIVYTEKRYVLKMASAIYPQIAARKGFQYDKSTKKLKTWWGSNINTLAGLSDFFIETGNEWVVNEGFYTYHAPPLINRRGVPPSILGWLTPTLLGAILSGKITNPTMLCKKIISTNGLRGMSPELLRVAIKNKKIDKYTLLYGKDCVTDKNHLLDVQLTNNHRDILKQCKALGKKADLKWSWGRLNEFHTEMTREIMGMELKMLPDVSFGWDNIPPLPEGFELINSTKRLFEEGTMMKHCVYTNYADKCLSKSYMVLRYNDTSNKKAWTIGLNKYGIDQISGVRNEYAPQDVRILVQNSVFPIFKEVFKNEKPSPAPEYMF